MAKIVSEAVIAEIRESLLIPRLRDLHTASLM